MAEHGIRRTGNGILHLFYAFPVDSFDGAELSLFCRGPLGDSRLGESGLSSG
jgi:hypothetical protein